jgi:hypothetical protein
LFKICVAGRLFVERSSNFLAFSDFTIIYSVLQIARSAERPQIYDPNVQLRFLNLLLGGIDLHHLPFAQFTPFFMLLFCPISAFSIDIAFLVWTLIGIALFPCALVLCLKAKHPPNKNTLITFVIAGMAAYPFLYNEWDGETGAMMAAMIGFFAVCWIKRKHLLAGLILGILLSKPTVLPFLLPSILGFRRYKIIGGACLSGAALLIASMLWFGPHTILNYPKVLYGVEANSSNFLGVYPENMVTLRALLAWMLPQNVALNLAFVAVAITLIVQYFLAAKARMDALQLDATQSADRELLHISLALLIASILSPHMFTYDLTIVAIAASLIWTTLETGSWRELRAVHYFRTICMTYPLFGMVLFMLVDHYSNPHFLIFHLILNVALLACLIMLIKTKI